MDNPCKNCLTFVICKQRILEEANKTDFSADTSREEMITIVMFSALKRHCSIIEKMAYIPYGERDVCAPWFPHNKYDSNRIIHLAETFGEIL